MFDYIDYYCFVDLHNSAVFHYILFSNSLLYDFNALVWVGLGATYQAMPSRLVPSPTIFVTDPFQWITRVMDP